MYRIKTSFIIIVILLCIIPPSVYARHFARWYTTMGNFTADLRDELVPITANNFIDLTNDGFYNGLHFHRVVANFVIQDGDPLGTGYGGPGYTIQDEFSPYLHHDSAGVLAMARTDQPNSAGSQYYITLRATSHLDGGYAVFGKVFEGLDVVMAIGQVPVGANSHPITNVVIDSLKILDLVINGVSPTDTTVAVYDPQSPYPFAVETYDSTVPVQYSWYLNEVLQEGQTEFFFQPFFTILGTNLIKCVTATEDVSWTTFWEVDVQSVHAAESNLESPPGLSLLIRPNPFKNSAKIVYGASKAGKAFLSVFDCKGRELHTISKYVTANSPQTWQWDGTDASGATLPSGIYYIRVSSGSNSRMQKCVLLK